MTTPTEKTAKPPKIPKYYREFCASVSEGYLRIDLEKKCKDERLHYLEYALTTPNVKLPNASWSKLNGIALTFLDELMGKAIENESYRVMEFLLESPKLKEHANIDLALIQAYDDENKDVMRFLLSSPNLSRHANINVTYEAFNSSNAKDKDSLLTTAVRNGKLELIEFLLCDSSLKEHADIHILNDKPIYDAVLRHQNEIVKFLLSSDKLKEHAKLDPTSSIFFLCSRENRELADYLILDYQMEYTPRVKEFFGLHEEKDADNPFENYVSYAKKLFDTREHYKLLNNDLNTQSIPTKKPKI